MRTRLSIKRGERFSRSLRIETLPYVYVPITAVTQSAPVRITAPGHGLLDGQRAAIVSVRGMSELNARSMPPKIEEYRQATVIDADTIEINTINASGFKPYKGDGYLSFNTPVDMTAMTARMSIKDKVGGTELLRLDTTNGGLTIDPDVCAITMTISAEQTELMAWKRGVYDLEIVDSLGAVHMLLAGKVKVTDEVTT